MIRLNLRWCPDLTKNGAKYLHIMNYFGVIYTFLIIFLLFGVNACYTCPEVYGWHECQTPILIGSFIAFNTFLNWYLFHHTAQLNKVSSSMRGLLNSVYGAETKHCYTCDQDVPIRSHHCPLCGYCILRKDHHCFLTGSCVGLGNQRFFLTFLFWGTMGAAYGTLYSFRYLDTFYVKAFPFGWIDYIFPVALIKFIVLQHCTFGMMCVILLFSMGWATTSGALGFFGTQWFFVLSGRTMWEQLHRMRVQDNLSISQRVRSVFGPCWYLQFICPIPFRSRADVPQYSCLHNVYVKEL